ncbi:uncharacterized protein LOC135366343 [Ornithodoros turicata]|uniref:uncharacterized protein LOC135366343 n=1 Tax=Ornithodoros turicata TaxID=34597 RepID=UPI0031390A38
MKRKKPSGTEGEGQQGGKSFKSSINIEKSQETATIRKAVHDAIVKGDLGEVERCLEKNKDIRQWLDPETEKSALCKAAEECQPQIRAYLVHRNCTINTEKKREERESFEQVKREKPLQDLEYHYQLGCMVPKCGFISHLVSRSSSKTGCNGFENKITKYYEALQKIATVDTILQVAATTSWLNVIFDFQSEDLGCIMSHIRGTARGVTLSREESIYLGAKREERDLLGTMAHEFCHFALNLVYGNNGKPYKRDGEERRVRYQHILGKIKSRKHGLHDMIQRAFQNSSVEEQELIVRIPHMLAMQSERCGTSTTEGVVGATLGENLLQNQVLELFEYYKDFVIPDMEAFITKNCSGKDKEQIREQNVRLRKAERARKLGIEFKTKYELRDQPLVVLTAPNLSFLEAKINDAVSLTGESYVFLETKQWDSELKGVLWKYKCHYVVLSSVKEYDTKKRQRMEMQDVLK